eukprot:SM006904S20506  [mRNA]  locus=s6904:59:496:- [translate_table: standard]
MWVRSLFCAAVLVLAAVGPARAQLAVSEGNTPCSHIPWYYPVVLPVITVPVGTTCTWYYMDATRNLCVASMLLDTMVHAPDNLEPGDTFSFTFSK